MNKEQITDLLTSSTDIMSSASTSSENNDENIKCFDSFNPRHEKFRSYKRRFEEFIKGKRIQKEDKLSALLFLNSIGSTGFKIVARALSPVNPYQCTYKQFIDILMKHYHPRRSEILIMHEFQSKYQEEDQSITEFSDDLKMLYDEYEEGNSYRNCEKCLSATENILLRTQFIRGLRDKSIQEEILKSQLTKFEEIEQLALALEDAKKEFVTMTGGTSFKNNHKVLIEYNETSTRTTGRKSILKYRNQGVEKMSLREDKTEKENSINEESVAIVNVPHQQDEHTRNDKIYKVIVKIASKNPETGTI